MSGGNRQLAGPLVLAPDVDIASTEMGVWGNQMPQETVEEKDSQGQKPEGHQHVRDRQRTRVYQGKGTARRVEKTQKHMAQQPRGEGDARRGWSSSDFGGHQRRSGCCS